MADQINISVKSNNFDEIVFRIWTTTILRKLFLKYCQRNNIKQDSIIFINNSEIVDLDKTVKENRLGEGDTILAVETQSGGGLTINWEFYKS